MKTVRSGMLVALLVVGAAVAGMGSSAAAVYRGSWDPAYGPDFPSLGFGGDALFEIPDACLATSGYHVSGSCGSSAMVLRAATVRLYNLTGSGPGTSEILTYAPPSLFAVLGVLVVDNEVVGVDTVALGPQPSSIAAALGASFFLQFFSGALVIGDVNVLAALADVGSILRGAVIYPTECPNGPCASPTSNAGVVTFTRVPEPGVLALVLAAVLAGWATRRRTAGR